MKVTNNKLIKSTATGNFTRQNKRFKHIWATEPTRRQLRQSNELPSPSLVGSGVADNTEDWSRD